MTRLARPTVGATGLAVLLAVGVLLIGALGVRALGEVAGQSGRWESGRMAPRVVEVPLPERASRHMTIADNPEPVPLPAAPAPAELATVDEDGAAGVFARPVGGASDRQNAKGFGERLGDAPGELAPSQALGSLTDAPGTDPPGAVPLVGPVPLP